MAVQNHQINLCDADSIDPHQFKEIFIQALRHENKRFEFEHKYCVHQIRALVQKDLGISVVEDLPISSSGSSFQLLHQTIRHFASRRGDSEQSMPQLWTDLVKIVISQSPADTEEPAGGESLGSNFEELESDGVHEEGTQDLNAAAIINSNHSHNLSSTDISINTVITPQNLFASPEISAQQVNPTRPNNVPPVASDSYTINMPVTPSASPQPEDNKLGFIIFAVELVGALSNVASSRPKHNQVPIYVVVACSTLAFSISSTALLLHKKRPTTAKKMQKAAFLIGTFGFMGILGMLLPSTITWCFTISAFLVCMLMFFVASLIN